MYATLVRRIRELALLQNDITTTLGRHRQVAGRASSGKAEEEEEVAMANRKATKERAKLAQLTAKLKRRNEVITRLTLLIDDHLDDGDDTAPSKAVPVYLPPIGIDAEELASYQIRARDAEQTLSNAREEFLRVTREIEAKAKSTIRELKLEVDRLTAELAYALERTDAKRIKKLERRIRRLREEHTTFVNALKDRLFKQKADAETRAIRLKVNEEGKCPRCGKDFPFPWPCPDCQIELYAKVNASLEEDGDENQTDQEDAPTEKTADEG